MEADLMDKIGMAIVFLIFVLFIILYVAPKVWKWMNTPEKGE